MSKPISKTKLDLGDVDEWARLFKSTCPFNELHVSAHVFCRLCAMQHDLFNVVNSPYYFLFELDRGRERRCVEIIRIIRRIAASGEAYNYDLDMEG